MHHRDQQILRLALPSIVSNITVPLLGLVDVAIVGHIGDARYISAIAVGTTIFNVLYWVFGFLRMGTGGMTSQAYGRRELDEVVRILLRTLSIGFGIGLLFVLLQRPVISLGLWAMQPDDSMLGLCRLYCNICIWGAPAMLSLYGLTGWFVGMQNTRLPMVVSISQNIINIVTSLTLVLGFRMDIAGVAAGTVIAQWGGLLIAVSLLWRHYGRLRIHARLQGLFNREALVRFFVVNRDIFLRTLFLVAVFLSFTAAGSRQGVLILAVNTLLMQLFTIFSYFSDGFAYAGEALCGRYHGAGNRQAFHETVRRLFVLGSIVTVAFTLLYISGGHAFLHLLTSDETVVEAAGAYFPWAVAIPAAGMAAFIFDGIFVGITHTKGLLLSSVMAAVCFFAVYMGLKTTMTNHALWLAFIVYLFARGVVEAVIYLKRA